MRPRVQIVCAWMGPVAIGTFFAGFAIAGFFPPPSPHLSLQQVAHLYSGSPDAVRLGGLIMVFSSGLVTPFAAAVAIQMRRIEGTESAVLSLTQLAAGTAGILLFLTEAMFWSIAAYRPHRPPEITQTLNDIAWFFTVMPFALIFVQALSIAAAIFLDDRGRPVYPRWLGYMNVWCALLYVPGGTCTFFKSGPLAWNGALAFWVPATVYCSWFVTMAIQTAKAANRHAYEARVTLA
jgi:hypothetical protein